ncbi:hypothetical protein ACFXPS_16775 [Nocardia sp. NPDC059091]|uniref:hypothetical protein n=1 Tax=unclassified Nocardia TaxID=2637762 RepID=UPI0036CF462E
MSKEDRAEELNHWESRLAEDPDYCDGYGRRIADWLRESKAADKDLIGFWGWLAATQSHWQTGCTLPGQPYVSIRYCVLTVLTEPAGTG